MAPNGSQTTFTPSAGCGTWTIRIDCDETDNRGFWNTVGAVCVGTKRDEFPCPEKFIIDRTILRIGWNKPKKIGERNNSLKTPYMDHRRNCARG